MTDSKALRLRDIRAAFRLIGECRDLGHDPGLWHRRMLDGLALLFGVVQAAAGEAWWDRPGRAVQPVSAYVVTVQPAGEDGYHAYARSQGWSADPILQAIEKFSAKLVTRTRRQLVSDDVWYGSDAFRYRQASHIDHQLVSVLRVSDNGATSIVALSRGLGEPDFSPREQRLLNFFHGELGRLIGGPLVGTIQPSVAHLSRRLRQTLACLVEGDSEKQVAARLGLSRATVHQYVTALYRHFGVRSRAQLLAHLAKRGRQLT